MESGHTALPSANEQSARLTPRADPLYCTARPLSAAWEPPGTFNRRAPLSSPGASSAASWSFSSSRCRRGVADARQVNTAEGFDGMPQPAWLLQTSGCDDNGGASDGTGRGRNSTHCEWGIGKDASDNTTGSDGDRDVSYGHNLLVPAQRLSLVLLTRANLASLRTRYFHCWWRAVLLRVAGHDSRSFVDGPTLRMLTLPPSVRAQHPTAVDASSPSRDRGRQNISHSLSASADEGAVRRTKPLSLRPEELVRVFYCDRLHDEEGMARAELEKEEAQACKRLLGAVRRAADEMLMLALRGGNPRQNSTSSLRWGIAHSPSAKEMTADGEEEDSEKRMESTGERRMESLTLALSMSDANATGPAESTTTLSRDAIPCTHETSLAPQPQTMHRACAVPVTQAPTRLSSDSPLTFSQPDGTARRQSCPGSGLIQPLLSPPAAATKGPSPAGPLAAAHGPPLSAGDNTPRGSNPEGAGESLARRALFLRHPQCISVATKESPGPTLPSGSAPATIHAAEKLCGREESHRRQIAERYRHDLERIIGMCFGAHSSLFAMNVSDDGIMGSDA